MQKGKPVTTDPGEPPGRYTNYLIVGHNAFEFLLGFGEAYENSPERIHTRLVAAPAYAKAMWATLGNALAAFEQEHGLILVPQPGDVGS